MATTEKKSNFREDFPGYQGHIPYKYSIIGKTVGSTNETIKELLSTEPPKETSLNQENAQISLIIIVIITAITSIEIIL